MADLSPRPDGLPPLGGDRGRGAGVLLAGAGNIGSFTAPLLARAGVRRLCLVDRDRVEEKNLITQNYGPEDVGRPKAEVLADRLRQQAPELTVEARHADLEDLPLREFEVDVILGGLDSRRARQILISEIAWPLGVPVVDGGVGAGLKGRVQVFVPGPHTACLECTWADEDYRQAAVEYPCLPDATTPPTLSPAFTGAVVAGIMTAECIHLLTKPAARESREIAFDLLHQHFLVSRLRRARRCRFDHEVVTERLPLGKAFVSASVADLRALIERRFGPTPVHLECRRGLMDGAEFWNSRLLPLDRLSCRASEPLRALGFRAADRVRLRSAAGSALVTFDCSDENPV